MRNGREDKENDLRLTNRWTESIVHTGTKCRLAFQSPVLHVILHAQLWQVCQVDVMTGGVDTAASTDLVALVNAVDELGVRGCPRKTDSCWVDRLGLHVAWSYGGHWDGWGEEEKVRQSGRKNKRRTEGKKQGCDNAFQFAVGSLPASV